MHKVYCLDEGNKILTAKNFHSRDAAIDFCQRMNHKYYKKGMLSKRIWRLSYYQSR